MRQRLRKSSIERRAVANAIAPSLEIKPSVCRLRLYWGTRRLTEMGRRLARDQGFSVESDEATREWSPRPDCHHRQSRTLNKVGGVRLDRYQGVDSRPELYVGVRRRRAILGKDDVGYRDSMFPNHQQREATECHQNPRVTHCLGAWRYRSLR